MSLNLKMRQSLSLFSAILVPDAEFEERGKAACQEILTILQSKRKDVAEFKISGSMGKRTAVYYPGMQEPDFDVVIFLNIKNLDEVCHPEKGPPFRRFLWEFRLVFQCYPSITILNDIAPNFLRIEMNGIQLDVSPAIFFKNSERPPGETREENQSGKTLEVIQSLKNPQKFGFYYTPGLTEASMDYFKTQAASLNAHPLIRLAKFWNRNLQLPSEVRYVTGRSFLIERMALFAAQELYYDEDGDDILSGLEKFLQLMSVLRTLVIHKPVPCRFAYYMEAEGPGMRPIVLDPVNPFNNLARLHHDPLTRRRIIKCFERGADNSLTKLRSIKMREKLEPRSLLSLDFIEQILDQSEFSLNLIRDKPTPVPVSQIQSQPSSSSSSLSIIPESSSEVKPPQTEKEESSTSSFWSSFKPESPQGNSTLSVSPTESPTIMQTTNQLFQLIIVFLSIVWLFGPSKPETG